jgi:hypothetical protein
MSPEAFVDSRSNIVDKDYTSKILFDSLRNSLPESIFVLTQIYGYEEIFKKIANSVVRAALSDIYNKMNPEHFEGYPDARKVAEKLYNEYNKLGGPYEEGGTGHNWELAGNALQDIWVAVAILSQKIWEQTYNLQEGFLPSPSEKNETAEYWEDKIKKAKLEESAYWQKRMSDEIVAKNEEIHKLNERINELDKLVNASPSEEKVPTTAEEAREIRGETYGHFHPNHEQVGQIWGGILSAYFGIRVPNLPASLVEGMMVGLKLWRIAKCPSNVDSHVDAANYLNMILESQQIERGDIPDPTMVLTGVTELNLSLANKLIAEQERKCSNQCFICNPQSVDEEKEAEECNPEKS